MSKINSIYTEEMICPHCGKAQRYVWELTETREKGTAFCEWCEEPFFWEIHQTVKYSTRPEK